MQQTKIKDHPRQAVVTDITIIINKKQKENHNIVLTMDDNEPFTIASGGIARICRECKLFDPLHHKHGNTCDSKSFLNGSDRIDFFLCSLNILTTILRCGMTGFNDITTSNYYEFFLDLSRDVILKGKTTKNSSPFERQLKSNSPKSVRKYKHYLKQQINKYNIESQIENILIIGKQRRLV